jgi:hypothetical protein
MCRWKFHCSRANHKTGSVKICIIREIARRCTCNTIKRILMDYCAISESADPGTSTYHDRKIEHVNK